VTATATGGIDLPMLGEATRPLSLGTRRRRLGETDLTVLPLALGGKVFGWSADDEATRAVLDRFADLGGNLVDTADSYAGGRSEIMIGSWMRSRRNRDDLVVSTKVGKGADDPGMRPAAIVAAVEASLDRLQTDRIDLLFLHIDDRTVPFDTTLSAVDALIRSGKVRWFGGSDHSGARLLQARVASAQLGVAPMVAVQKQYHLMAREDYERDLAHIAQGQRLAVLPRFALASGFLSGRYRRRADLLGSPHGIHVAKHLTRHGMRVLAALDRVAAEHDAPVASVALAWLLAKPRIVAPVVSATRAEQVDDLVRASALVLTRGQVAALDRASAR